MAKSKSGGSRAFIRGKLANDVYSIGKDSVGNKIQVVRSLAEQVANPRTAAQMKGRMIMSTVMQAVSSLAYVIDHSFDGLPKGQPSISEFIRRNYALVKADADTNASGNNVFGLNKYGEKGAKGGAYVISAGSVPSFPAAITLPDGFNLLEIVLTAGATVASLKAKLNYVAGDFFTMVSILISGKAASFQIHIDDTVSDDTVISADNIATIVTVDNAVNCTPTVSFVNNTIKLGNDADQLSSCGVIVSRKIDGAWNHSTETMAAHPSQSWKSDVALPTYPTGTEMYLNGGEA